MAGNEGAPLRTRLFRNPRNSTDSGDGLPRLRQQCDEFLEALAVPPHSGLSTFLAALTAHRGRPVVLHPWPGRTPHDAPCGAWFATDTTDWICFEPHTSRLHRNQIILHECAHMLLGHRFGTEPSEARKLFPDLGPGLVSRALSRTDYTSRQEHDAEMLASLLSLHLGPRRDDAALGRRDPGPRGPAGGSQQFVLLRLRPLWRVLTGAFPGVVLGTPPTLWDDLTAGRNPALRLHRRVIEIRDAALALRPYVPGAAGVHLARTVAEPGPHGERLRAAAEALCLHAALHNKAAADASGRTPVTAPRPHSGPEERSGSSDRTDEFRMLCLLARAFRRNHPAQVGGLLQLLPQSG